MTQLICDNLSLGYDGKAIISGLSFSVNAGDYLCILGENGSGKSTLMKAILNLQSPLSGRISTGGGLSRREIGYLPQQSALQKDFPASVWEIVISGCQGRHGLNPFYSAAEKKLCAECMEKMGISHLSKRCYRTLSGGQQQKALLARALLATGKMLLLDEPVSGLDPKSTSELYQLIEERNRKDGIGIIMITHDIPAALRYADHILHIGKEVFFGTTEEYLRSGIEKGTSLSEGGEVK